MREHKQTTELKVRTTQYDPGKRVIDLAGSIALLSAAAPVMLGVAVAVYISSGWPVVYSQKRLTQGGRVFTIFKFRTMRKDAESKSGAVWAQVNDPRVTKIGHFLRITRLDELPQLFNVLLGDMSLIGPRPERPEIAEELAKQLPSFNRRLEVKAGITGLAQVSRGYVSNLESYRHKLALDLLYIKKRCLLLDIQIALKTIIVVITGSGAR